MKSNPVHSFKTTISTASRRNEMSLTATIGSVTPSSSPIKVAIIGAGAAGLVTARVLKRNGIEPIILEKDAQDTGVGGVWSYKPNSDSRPMYRGLRTNLPREIMAYREFPWGGDGKTMSFATHEEVKDYLSRYAKTMDVEDLIQYQSTVTKLEIVKSEEKKTESDGESLFWPQIKLEWDSARSNDKDIITHSEIFDAVCVCNGHYDAPANPIIPGIEKFQGEIIHSITYDDPSIFKGKKVLCIGGRASGSDLAREISQYAKHVYLSDTTCPTLVDGKPITEENISWVPRTTEVLLNSRVSFGSTCDETPEVDIIVFCSGYDYQFPFINELSNLDLSVIPGERRVKPLYEQLWHARYPSLTFIGLQHSVVPFPFFELQAEAVVSQLVGDSSSKSWTLPSLDVRMDCAEKDANCGGPKPPGRVQDTHFLGSYQWDECLKYARFAGLCDESLKKYIMTNKAIYNHSGEQRKSLFPGGPDRYRYNSYVRDDENESFQVNSLHHEMGVEDNSHPISSSSTAHKI
jgi:thioredoxin reductase